MTQDDVTQTLHGHTPGPWLAAPDYDELNGTAVIRWSDDGDDTQTDTDGDVICWMPGQEPETVAADAQLIAAAPDLLAACVEMICTLQIECGDYQCMNNAGQVRTLEDAFGEEIAKMNAAIQKAGFHDTASDKNK